MTDIRKLTVHEVPSNAAGDRYVSTRHLGYSVHCEGDVEVTLRFTSPDKALRFIGHILEAVDEPEVVEVLGVACLHHQVAPTPLRTGTPATLTPHTTSPEHERFIRRAAAILYAALPMTQRRERLLKVFRALLPADSMAALRTLPPEVLIARLKTELPDDLPASFAQAASF